MNKSPKIYYVYEHWRPDTNMCFYVGKGKGQRAYNFNRGNYYNNVAAKIFRLGLMIIVKIIKSDMTEAQSHALEVKRIAYWKTKDIKLTNQTEGGEGSSGFRHSKKSRLKLKQLALIQWKNPENRKRLIIHLKNLNSGSRMKQSTTLKLWWSNPKNHKQMVKAHKGKINSKESIVKQRKAITKVSRTIEGRIRLSKAALIRWADPKEKINHSKRMKAYWAKQKENSKAGKSHQQK